jgi:nitrite reductase/ring-hydroxylating ferredoxin subunit
MQPEATPQRRTVVLAGVVTLAGAGTLAACGSSGAGGAAATASAPAGGAASSGANPSASGGNGAAGSGDAIVKVADVPLGGAVVATAASGAVVVAQPTAGQVVAYSAICPHAGCKVAPAGQQLRCPCHGSTFELATGKVLRGPAKKDLTPVAVKVSGQDVVAG